MVYTDIVKGIPHGLIQQAENLIDPTSIDIILNYIRADDTEIDFAINVNERSDLATISAMFSDQNEKKLTSKQFEVLFLDLLKTNKIKLLTMTDFKKLPGNTLCWAIHQPPAYLICIDESTYFE